MSPEKSEHCGHNEDARVVDRHGEVLIGGLKFDLQLVIGVALASFAAQFAINIFHYHNLSRCGDPTLKR